MGISTGVNNPNGEEPAPRGYDTEGIADSQQIEGRAHPRKATRKVRNDEDSNAQSSWFESSCHSGRRQDSGPWIRSKRNLLSLTALRSAIGGTEGRIRTPVLSSNGKGMELGQVSRNGRLPIVSCGQPIGVNQRQWHRLASLFIKLELPELSEDLDLAMRIAFQVETNDQVVDHRLKKHRCDLRLTTARLNSRGRISSPQCIEVLQIRSSPPVLDLVQL